MKNGATQWKGFLLWLFSWEKHIKYIGKTSQCAAETAIADSALWCIFMKPQLIVIVTASSEGRKYAMDKSHST